MPRKPHRKPDGIDDDDEDDDGDDTPPVKRTRRKSVAAMPDDDEPARSTRGARTSPKTSPRSAKAPPKTPSKTSSKTPSKPPAKPPAKTPAKTSASTEPRGSKSTAKAATKTATKGASKAKPKVTQRRRRSGDGGSWMPAGGWRRWLLIELLTVGAGVAFGVSIACVVAWSRAKTDVAGYLSNPPRPVPSVVWSAPIQVRAGMAASVDALSLDLLAAGYERVTEVAQPSDPDVRGVFAVTPKGIDLWSAPWTGPTGSVEGGKASIAITNGKVASTSDRKGLVLRPTVLGALGDVEKERTKVHLADLSPWVEKTLLAMEDTRFREHHGIDPLGILRALVRNALGKDTQGGSTLTQQLAKNLFLTRDRTLRRKVRELFFAAALEHELDKDELLELYLSEVYLGQMGGLPLYGVDAAARAWFGVSAKNLDLPQTATIVGAIPAPNLWSPVRNPEAARARRTAVLDRMKAIGRIDDAQYAAAVAAETPLAGLEPSRVRRAPYAVDAAVDKAEDALGQGALAAGGFQVYTGIQPLLQRAAEDAVAAGMAELDEDYPKAAGAQVALVAVSIHDGTVVAMVGGRSYAASAFNRARDASRLAGSTVKPLTLLKALDAGTVTPATILEDAPLVRNAGGERWEPHNYDNKFVGDITVRDAIEGSRNIPAILMAETIGAVPLQRFYKECGLSGATSVPSAALGAFGATPMEMAGAFTAFGHGVAYSPRVLVAIADGHGKQVLDAEPEGTPVASEQAAAVAVHVLQGVIESGTGSSASRWGVGPPAAGKTGTTDEYRDAWFVGITPELAVAVWVGQDEGVLGLSGSRAALPTWARFVAASGTNHGAMPRPTGVVTESVCAESGLLARDACPHAYDEWFVAGHLPEEKCDVHGGPVIRPGRLFGRLFRRNRPDDEGTGTAGETPTTDPPQAEVRPRRRR